MLAEWRHSEMVIVIRGNILRPDLPEDIWIEYRLYRTKMQQSKDKNCWMTLIVGYLRQTFDILLFMALRNEVSW